MSIVAQIHTPIKTLNEKAIESEGSIVIRLGLDGIRYIEILAEDSHTEASLLKLLRELRPSLGRLYNRVQAQTGDLVGAGG